MDDFEDVSSDDGSLPPLLISEDQSETSAIEPDNNEQRVDEPVNEGNLSVSSYHGSTVLTRNSSKLFVTDTFSFIYRYKVFVMKIDFHECLSFFSFGFYTATGGD